MLFMVAPFVALLAFVSVSANALGEPAYSFEDYVRDFHRSYAPKEVPQRKRAVEDALRRIAAHNAMPGRRWDAGVNEFTDRTAEELRTLGGYDKVQGFSGLVGVAQPKAHSAIETLPNSFDWREKGVVTAVKEQHTCQGCWAFAAVESIESALAIAGEQLVELSVEEVISCTPNPEHCGGSGGCGGATAEQAFNFSMKSGLTTEAAYPYKHYPFSRHTCDETRVRSPAAVVGGFTRLPPNDDHALLTALVNQGPIAVTVAATSWMLYDGGIFDGELGMGCGTDLNHQVSLVGYGEDQGTNYWLVRNSYGPKWGEQGYIRLLRAASGQKEACASDDQPTDGYCGKEGWCACPKSITVCGMCGILADSSYPTGVHRAAQSSGVPVVIV
eukprot:CAMPEP_0117539966 /NCGR_PEP_ID=MMETSP0784-20121206/43256_1 /TAXON_ID=39447 /ORGANISM="" /LENGTH=385 /DNA_ID=CAMNT_0005336607 /DNA_START=38 /DNA_END=1195 /DNA_ORIENTATION=-